MCLARLGGLGAGPSWVCAWARATPWEEAGRSVVPGCRGLLLDWAVETGPLEGPGGPTPPKLDGGAAGESGPKECFRMAQILRLAPSPSGERMKWAAPLVVRQWERIQLKVTLRILKLERRAARTAAMVAQNWPSSPSRTKEGVWRRRSNMRLPKLISEAERGARLPGTGPGPREDGPGPALD